jgi:hypothetical protein
MVGKSKSDDDGKTAELKGAITTEIFEVACLMVEGTSELRGWRFEATS